MIEITLPTPPSANRYWRTYRGRTVVSEDAKIYKTTVGWLARAAVTEPLRGDVSVTLNWHRPARRGDLDNVAKVTLDALQGIVYDNDSQIVELHAYRHDDKDNPRMVVRVAEVR